MTIEFVLVIEFPRKRAVSIAAVLLGAIFVFVGLVALAGAPIAARVFFLVLGGLLFLLGLHRAVARTPRFRATADGVWFGGGATIPWADVDSVFESNLDVRGRHASGIAFQFRDRRTLFRTPIEHWLTSPFAVGHIDVSPPATNERTVVLVSRLEAMRTAASTDRSAG